MKTIVVSGTPGTGKTTVSKQIAKLLDFEYIDVNKIIETNGLSEGYDDVRQCKIVDVEALKDAVSKNIEATEKKGVIIDSHLSHHLEADLCIITKCDLKILEQRLKDRDYDEAKIRENLDSEIFDVCFVEATELGHNVLSVDTSNSIDFDDLLANIERMY